MTARSVLILGSLLFGAITASSPSTGSRFNPIENLFQPLQNQQNESRNFQIPQGPHPNAPSAEEREKERQARRERNRQRRANVAEAMKNTRPDTSKLEKLSQEEVDNLTEKHPNEFRKLWGGSKESSSVISYADPGDDYDMWQQAYRMLGGFIDCDHSKSEGSGDGSGDGGGGDGEACSRWMMWASVSRMGMNSFVTTTVAILSLTIRSLKCLILYLTFYFIFALTIVC